MTRNEDDDDRPRRRRSRDDEEDEEDDRPRKRKKKAKPSRPLPGLLLAMVIIAWVWGGLCFFSAAGQILHALSELWKMFGAQAGLNNLFGIRIEFSPMMKIMAAMDLLFCLANFILSIGIIAGGFLLFFRRAIGRNLVVFCPVGMAGCLVLSAIAMGIALGGALGLIWFLLLAYGIGIAIHLVVAFVFLKLQEYPDVHRSLH